MLLTTSKILQQRSKSDAKEREDTVLITQEACDYLRISRPTYVKCLQAGRIKGIKLGKGWESSIRIGSFLQAENGKKPPKESLVKEGRAISHSSLIYDSWIATLSYACAWVNLIDGSGQRIWPVLSFNVISMKNRSSTSASLPKIVLAKFEIDSWVILSGFFFSLVVTQRNGLYLFFQPIKCISYHNIEYSMCWILNHF